MYVKRERERERPEKSSERPVHTTRARGEINACVSARRMWSVNLCGYFDMCLNFNRKSQRPLTAINTLSPSLSPPASMLNVSVQQEARTETGGRVNSGNRTSGHSNVKKSSVTTKIILKEAARPHHNLGERVAQVSERASERGGAHSGDFNYSLTCHTDTHSDTVNTSCI